MAEISTDEIIKRVHDLALPLLAKANVDLVELKVGRHKSDVLIQFTADKPNGGISIEECATLNHAIVAAIDADGFLGDTYALEFSSPGLDRPLKTQKDFLRHVNAEVHLWLKAPIERKHEINAVILGVEQDMVKLLIKKNTEIVIPIEQIQKALLEI